MAHRTPLYESHRALGARMVEFAGWDMPVSYVGATEEHHAVRNAVGIFDVSHMGEVELRGPGAEALAQRLTVNDVGRLQDGQAQYSVLCAETGGVIDDLIVYRLAPERFLFVVNAGNRQRDLAWIRARASDDVEVVDQSDSVGLIAVQGPAAEVTLAGLADGELGSLPAFSSRPSTVAGVQVLVARTGYTGEDGFELVVPEDDLVEVWARIVDAARAQGGMPAGLAARDTLRLEAGLPLCGTDMDDHTTPLEAGLGWVVKLGAASFIGSRALAAQRDGGVPRRLVGLELDAPGVPRHGYLLLWEGREVGVVTSGARSPTLGRAIAMGMVESQAAKLGTRLEMEVRGRRLPARIVTRPFYRRAGEGADAGS